MGILGLFFFIFLWLGPKAIVEYSAKIMYIYKLYYTHYLLLVKSNLL